VTESTGAVRYIRGSHRWGWFDPNIFSGRTDSTDEFPPPPDIEANLDTYEILSWDLEPGDCTVHHGLEFHGGYGNSSAATRRRGCSFRMAGDSARYATRKKVEPIFREPELCPGDRLVSAVFPLIYEEAGPAGPTDGGRRPPVNA
jgi:ectoine hydroxylase-related dioxygenase (phytanoyl-CoA dioxygenase family)